jgi:succinyl-CoA synthetase alpha subunit
MLGLASEQLPRGGALLMSIMGGAGMLATAGALPIMGERIDRLGGGISQAIGTGGHDLSNEVGGISMLTGLKYLTDDPDTKVITLISKPPSKEIADQILGKARSSGKPVVVIVSRVVVPRRSEIQQTAQVAGNSGKRALEEILVRLLHQQRLDQGAHAFAISASTDNRRS